MKNPRPFGSAPVTLLLDILVVAWVVACILFGMLVADGVEELTVLSDGITGAGSAVVRSGDAIGGAELPVVGKPFGGVGEEIAQAGREVEGGGRSSRADIETLARLLGIALALIAMLPVLINYLPQRLTRGRELHAVRRMRRSAGGDPLFVEFLARRATERLSYRQLRKVSETPWRDLAEGRYTELAEAELKRVGLTRTALAGADR